MCADRNRGERSWNTIRPDPQQAMRCMIAATRERRHVHPAQRDLAARPEDYADVTTQRHSNIDSFWSMPEPCQRGDLDRQVSQMRRSFAEVWAESAMCVEPGARGRRLGVSGSANVWHGRSCRVAAGQNYVASVADCRASQTSRSSFISSTWICLRRRLTHS